MNDLISRSALIMRLNDYALQVAPFRDMKSTWQYDAVQECIKAVEEQLTVEPAADVPDIYVGNKWIPVSERLPEDEEKVLVCTLFEYKRNDEIKRVHNITCAMYESGNLMCEDSDYSWDYDCRGEYDEDKDDYHTLEGWFEITVMEHEEWTAVGIDRKVIAWMPLPEPYKED